MIYDFNQDREAAAQTLVVFTVATHAVRVT